MTNTYTRRGQKSTTIQGAITTTFAYTDSGQLLSESYSGGPLDGLSVTNGYDSLLRRNAVAARNGATVLGDIQNFVYDAHSSRLAGVSSGNISAEYGYAQDSSLVETITFKQSTATRMVTTKAYDYINRLKWIDHSTNSSTLASYSYQYNTASQRTKVTELDGSYWVYEYDKLGQVTSGKKYWSDGTPVAGQQFEYGFDDIGNRKTTAGGGDEWGANLRHANYYVNSLNQYTERTVPGAFDVIGTAKTNATVTVNNQPTYRRESYFRAELEVGNDSEPVWQSVTNLAVLKNGASADITTNVVGNVLVSLTPQEFYYDADGNMTLDGMWTNTWNAENRLVSMESTGEVPAAARKREQWTHLHDGRWIERIISTWNGSSYVPTETNRFLWDRQFLLAILNQTNGLVMSFVRGLDLSGSMRGAGGVGGLLAVSFTTNGTHFVANDGNGNVTRLVNAADSSSTAEYEYEPFGKPLRETGLMAKLNPIRFSSQYIDDVVHHVKYLYRGYSPESGKWSSKDPIDEVGGVNLYGFAGNDCINRIDSLGLSDPNKKVEGTPCDCKKGPAKLKSYKIEDAKSTTRNFKWKHSYEIEGEYLGPWTKSWTCTWQKDHYPDEDNPATWWDDADSFKVPEDPYILIVVGKLSFYSCIGGKWRLQEVTSSNSLNIMLSYGEVLVRPSTPGNRFD